MVNFISNNNDIRITALLPEHARAVAELHISGIKTGFISSLGLDFVTALYETIAASRFSFGIVAEREKKIVGFVVFTDDINKLYRSAILSRGLRFTCLLAGKMLSVHRIRNAIETASYPRRISKLGVPRTALLSIAVAAEERGKRLASELIRKGFAECRRRSIDKVRVLVGANNKPANDLYSKCSFELAGQIKNHDVISNVYEARTDLSEQH